MEYGWPVDLRVCRPFGKGLYGVRSSLSSNRIGKVIFCFQGSSMVLLHGFIKQTQKTPKADIEIARSRQMEIGATSYDRTARSGTNPRQRCTTPQAPPARQVRNGSKTLRPDGPKLGSTSVPRKVRAG